jgi:hypothetical protein
MINPNGPRKTKLLQKAHSQSDGCMLLTAETGPIEGALQGGGPWSYGVSRICWILSYFEGEVAQSNFMTFTTEESATHL